MSSRSLPATAFPCVVHPFPTDLGLSCAYESGDPSVPNALVFIGGLGDGPHTVSFIRTVSKQLEHQSATLGYSVFEVRLKTSFGGWGLGDLASDVSQLRSLVQYLRGVGKKRIVFFGHSTGCQDCMKYVQTIAGKSGEPLKPEYDHTAHHVDGFILQGPVSDREAIASLLAPEDLQKSIEAAKQLSPQSLMPLELLPRDMARDSAVRACRWLSLTAYGGDDDYFSSDLADELVARWAFYETPVLVLPSAEDEYVPSYIDKMALLEKWRKACPRMSPLSTLIPGGNHSVEDREAQTWLADRVAQFLRTIEPDNKNERTGL